MNFKISEILCVAKSFFHCSDILSHITINNDDVSSTSVDSGGWTLSLSFEVDNEGMRLGSVEFECRSSTHKNTLHNIVEKITTRVRNWWNKFLCNVTVCAVCAGPRTTSSLQDMNI